MAHPFQIEYAAKPEKPQASVGADKLHSSVHLNMPAVSHGETPAERLAKDQLERRKAGRQLTRMLLDHPCDLDPAGGVTECDHADHDRDAEAVGELLDALGLTEHLRTAAPKPTTKRCTGCQDVKDLEAFPRRNDLSDRRISRCRTCRNDHSRAYRIAEKEAGQ